MSMDVDALRGRANELGVDWSYWDNEGRYHESDMEAVRRVVEVLEADVATGPRHLAPVIVGSPANIPIGDGVDQVHLTLADGTELELEVSDGAVSFSDLLPIGNHQLSLAGPGLDESTTIVVAPERMPTSATLAGRTGVFAPAYALWEHDSQLPSFEQLRGLSEALPGLGVDLLVTLPLYAGFLDEPFDPSPYAPVSRLHWNEVYISDTGLPEADVPPIGDLVDWQLLARRRRRQLLDVAEALAAGSDPVLSARIDHWVDEHLDVADYARFRATVAVDPTDQTRPRPVVEASHRLAQFLAEAQLSELEGVGSAAFALDLPIGSHPAGYETWAYPDLWAPAMAVGAPPDMMFEGGQNWGFPPQLPGAAQRTGYALWRKIVGRCGRHASMLRIDHVLGVHRLWWIPDGMDARSGVYVRYPRHELISGDRRRGGAGEHDRGGRGSGHRAPGDDRSSRGMGHAGPVCRGDAHVRTRVGAGAGPQRGRCPHPRHAGVRRAVPRHRHGAVPSPPRGRARPAGGRHAGGVARRGAQPARPVATPMSSSPISTTCSVRPRRTTSPAWCRRRRGGGVCASRRRSRCRIPRCGPTSKC